MSKFTNAHRDIESVFATSAWTSLNIPAYPVGLSVPSDKTEFVKVEFLPLRENIDYSRFGIEGLAIIQIYIPTNQGIKRLMEIADFLDSILQNKSLNNGTKTGSSFLNILGSDTDNPSLFRGDYQVNFTFFN
jgi:hypothetical protein